MNLNSPKGLMLHGEVGTGKSMLVDLFADCLPNRKKRRWHFNTFMLETFARLEQLRRERLSRMPPSVTDSNLDDYSMLWLARDMIKTSPILFLDEFQLPDRAASKIMTNLMTSFFQLGGVLIATSNRMPDELYKAAGMTFGQAPSTMDSIRWRFGMARNKSGRSENLFSGQSEFTDFLDVLKARCDVWEMEGKKDYRRQEVDGVAPIEVAERDSWELDDHQDLQRIPLDHAKDALEELLHNRGQDVDRADSLVSDGPAKNPQNYLITPDPDSPENVVTAFNQHFETVWNGAVSTTTTDWVPSTMRVYGRIIPIPRTAGGTTSWTFTELCGSTLGPADYITLASTYHTLILTEVPILTFLQKNEARRFITLLDALYEAKCKLLITAAAGPDDIFFPEKTSSASKDGSDGGDAVYPETLSEVYQDVTAPFRPNISTQNPDYAEPDYDPEPDYTHSRLQGMLAEDSLEDDPPNRVSRDERDRAPIDPDDEMARRRRAGPNFAQTGAFTGEDERFAYKRARSRLWEMCGAKWWARDEEGWHRPVPLEVRRWETSNQAPAVGMSGRVVSDKRMVEDAGMGGATGIDEQKDEVLFRHGASPFRTATEPPPKFNWTHIWGTMKWGKKAGAWGQGVEGLKDREKDKK